MKRRKKQPNMLRFKIELDQNKVTIEKTRLGMKQKRNILKIENKNEVYFLHSDTILYIEANGNFCDIHLVDGDVLETVSFQRGEVAGMIIEQLTPEAVEKFALLGRQHLISTDHVMYINAPKQQLLFDINLPGTCKKQSIKASAKALRALRQSISNPVLTPTVTAMRPQEELRRINGGFMQHMESQPSTRHYNIGEDEVMILHK